MAKLKRLFVKQTKSNQNQFIMIFFAFSLGMVLSNLLSQNATEPEKKAIEILFTYKGIDKTVADLSSINHEALKKLDAKRHALLERAALEQYLYDYAEKEQLTIALAGNKLFKLEEPSKQDINAFYAKHAEQLKQPFYEIKADIKRQLTIQMAHKAKTKALERLIARGDLVIF